MTYEFEIDDYLNYLDNKIAARQSQRKQTQDFCKWNGMAI